MDILNKIKIILQDETGATVAGNIETNTTKGNVDVIGGECPDGYEYCSIKKICVPKKSVSEKIDIFLETTYSGGGYGVGAVISGSGQTRVVGKYSDKEVININKKDGVKWNKILGMYVPIEKEI